MTDADAALVFAGEGWHRGVVGIVASRVVERFHRPVFVLGIGERRGARLGAQHPRVSFTGSAGVHAGFVHANSEGTGRPRA